MILLILTESPYGTDVVYNGLRFADSLADKAEVQIFLMCDAVSAALEGQSGANDDTNIGRRLGALLAKDVGITICGRCLETRGLHASRLIPGVKVGTMPDLAELTLLAEKTIAL